MPNGGRLDRPRVRDPGRRGDGMRGSMARSSPTQRPLGGDGRVQAFLVTHGNGEVQHCAVSDQREPLVDASEDATAKAGFPATGRRSDTYGLSPGVGLSDEDVRECGLLRCHWRPSVPGGGGGGGLGEAPPSAFFNPGIHPGPPL